MTYDFCEGKLCINSLQEFFQINFFKKLLLKDGLHEMRDHMILPVDNPLGSQTRWLGLT